MSISMSLVVFCWAIGVVSACPAIPPTNNQYDMVPWIRDLRSNSSACQAEPWNWGTTDKVEETNSIGQGCIINWTNGEYYDGQVMPFPSEGNCWAYLNTAHPPEDYLACLPGYKANCPPQASCDLTCSLSEASEASEASPMASLSIFAYGMAAISLLAMLFG
eukprot:CAMPEP_0170593064 /NCGR_PEP_ID=MMETSP0224-20130122/13249_1 /TAXON_ID=285029 /ORGANISM="Togula jolla, Strain CCCM 725" /LENGTH=161 /DNA_ID=CAMNT_0010916993 /DNA_START=49 /DNA_END=534 /DNA_ORIENTATION=+